MAGAPAFRSDLVITLTTHYVPRFIGMPPFQMAGALAPIVLSQGGSAAFWSSIAAESVLGLLAVLAYARVLLGWRRQSSLASGAGLGLALWVAAMLLAPIALQLHPLVESGHMRNPGLFLFGLGMGWLPALFSLGAHLVYGLFTGAIYKHRVSPSCA